MKSIKIIVSIIIIAGIILSILSTGGCNQAEITDQGDTYFRCNIVPSEELSREKLENALNVALKKVDGMIISFATKFPSECSINNKYSALDNDNGWGNGFWSGILWHAYELSKDDKYKNVAVKQVSTFYSRIQNKLGVNHHDMGFLYIPSCVSAYKLSNNDLAKESAIMAAEQLIFRYHDDAKFIQAWGEVGAEDNYRLIIDCLMNIPLLYWATDVTHNDKYKTIAYNHFKTTVNICYRADGSTYHTYYFDKTTGQPTHGATTQGAGDDSAWSRGQAWGMYGPLLTYKYIKDQSAFDVFIKATDYFIEHLPSDCIPYWDLSFDDNDFEPKDSSSAVIAVCAMLEGVKYMDEDDYRKETYILTCNKIMNSLIDYYTSKDLQDSNGLLLHGTYSRPDNIGVDEMTIWGDYFYMEALHRMLDSEWELYW